MSLPSHYSLLVKVRSSRCILAHCNASPIFYSLAHSLTLSLVYANHVTGHKSEDALRDRNPLLRWYYSIYVLFGYCCVGAECFYILLYVYHFTHNSTVWNLAMYACGPACVMKNIINFVQMWSAAYAIAERDAENRAALKK
jgi:hypothetical protein